MAATENEDLGAESLFSFLDEDGCLDPDKVLELAPALLSLLGTPIMIESPPHEVLWAVLKISFLMQVFLISEAGAHDRDRLLLSAGVLLNLAVAMGESVDADDICSGLWEEQYPRFVALLLEYAVTKTDDLAVFEIVSDCLVPVIDAAGREQIQNFGPTLDTVLERCEHSISLTETPEKLMQAKQWLSVLSSLVVKLKASVLAPTAPRIARLYLNSFALNDQAMPFMENVDTCVHLLEYRLFGQEARDASDDDNDDDDGSVDKQKRGAAAAAAPTLDSGGQQPTAEQVRECRALIKDIISKMLQYLSDNRQRDVEQFKSVIERLDDVCRVMSIDLLAEHAATIVSTLLALIEPGTGAPFALWPNLLVICASCTESKSIEVDALHPAVFVCVNTVLMLLWNLLR
jgi:hypothetical protein